MRYVLKYWSHHTVSRTPLFINNNQSTSVVCLWIPSAEACLRHLPDTWKTQMTTTLCRRSCTCLLTTISWVGWSLFTSQTHGKPRWRSHSTLMMQFNVAEPGTPQNLNLYNLKYCILQFTSCVLLQHVLPKLEVQASQQAPRLLYYISCYSEAFIGAWPSYQILTMAAQLDFNFVIIVITLMLMINMTLQDILIILFIILFIISTNQIKSPSLPFFTTSKSIFPPHHHHHQLFPFLLSFLDFSTIIIFSISLPVSS